MRKTYVTAVLALAMSAGLALAAGAAETEPDTARQPARRRNLNFSRMRRRR